MRYVLQSQHIPLKIKLRHNSRTTPNTRFGVKRSISTTLSLNSIGTSSIAERLSDPKEDHKETRIRLWMEAFFLQVMKAIAIFALRHEMEDLVLNVVSSLCTNSLCYCLLRHPILIARTGMVTCPLM